MWCAQKCMDLFCLWEQIPPVAQLGGGGHPAPQGHAAAVLALHGSQMQRASHQQMFLSWGEEGEKNPSKPHANLSFM